MKLKKSHFKAFFTGSHDIEEDWYCFNKLYENYSKYIDEENLLCFLAQVGHESNLLKHKAELWSYSRGALLRVFPKYFNEKNVDKYVRSPEVLNRAYANRMGNGSESSGDGFKYRGRGFIQLTGKNNYRKYGYADNPKKLLDSYHAWKVGFLFWIKNKLHITNDLKKQTRKINGGYNGLQDRFKKYKKLSVLVKKGRI